MLSPSDEGQLAALQSDIALLDRPVPQVMVDVLVTELSRDASRQLGLDWEYAAWALDQLDAALEAAGVTLWSGE